MIDAREPSSAILSEEKSYFRLTNEGFLMAIGFAIATDILPNGGRKVTVLTSWEDS